MTNIFLFLHRRTRKQLLKKTANGRSLQRQLLLFSEPLITPCYVTIKRGLITKIKVSKRGPKQIVHEEKCNDNVCLIDNIMIMPTPLSL